MEIYEGTVMTFTIEKHWGFIHGPMLYEHGIVDRPEKGIFFHGKDVTAGRFLTKGEQVTFNLTRTEAGKPQAVNVTSQDSPQGGADPWGSQLSALSGLGAGLLGIDPERRYEGSVMSFVQEKHWGFLHCTQLYELGLLDGPDRGVFFHGKDVTAPTVLTKGDPVSFTVVINNGKLQGKTVMPLNASPAIQDYSQQGQDYSQLYGAAAQIAEAAQLAEATRLAGGSGTQAAAWAGSGTQSAQVAAAQAVAAQAAGTATDSSYDQRFYGEVTSFSPQDGCGFVHCPELTPSYFPENIFFHADDFQTMGDVTRGTQISFTVEQSATASGKPRARQIQHSDPAAAAGAGGRLAAPNPQYADPSVYADPAIYADPSVYADPAIYADSASTSTGTASVTPDAAHGKRLVGNILSWNVEKAWGFVSAPGLEAMVGPGKGIFFHIKDYAEYLANGSHPTAGMQVSFTFTLDHTGKPRATDVIADGSVGAAGSLSPQETVASNRAAAPMNNPALLASAALAQVTRQVQAPRPAAVRQSPFAAAPVSALVNSSDSRIEGTIMSYNEQKAWGFLTAPGLDSILGAGKGIFFHIKDFLGGANGPAPRPGLAVSFAHSSDHEGKYRAHQVMPVAKYGGGPGGEPASFSDEQRYEGTIQNYNQEKVWGFIGCPALEPMLGPGKGVFFHLKDCFGFQGAVPAQGMNVSFTVTIDTSGKPHASNVLPSEPKAEASLAPDVLAAVDAAMGVMGVIKRPNEGDLGAEFSADGGLPAGGGKRMRWS